MFPSSRPSLSVAEIAENPHNDKALWINFRDGNRDALGELYQRHLLGMYRHGLFYCKDSDLVRDCMQELFSRLWIRRKRISDADCVRSYLYKSLKRIVLTQIVRKRKRSLPLDEAPEPRDMNGSREQSIIDREFRKEQAARIKAGLESLTKSQREVIILRYFNGLTYAQISEIMDLRIESVYNLVSKAIEQLRHGVQIAA